MQNIETPSSWVVLKIKPVDEPPIYKILGGWYGGYMYGDSWKISSGVDLSKPVKITENFLHIPQYSGTMYKLRKGGEQMSSVMLQMYGRFSEQLGANVELFGVVPVEELLQECLIVKGEDDVQ